MSHGKGPGFGDAQPHVKCAKSSAANHTYYLGLAMQLQATSWYRQHRLEEARSVASCAVDMFEKLGVARGLKKCRALLWRIEGEMNKVVIPGEWIE